MMGLARPSPNIPQEFWFWPAILLSFCVLGSNCPRCIYLYDSGQLEPAALNLSKISRPKQGVISIEAENDS